MRSSKSDTSSRGSSRGSTSSSFKRRSASFVKLKEVFYELFSVLNNNKRNFSSDKKLILGLDFLSLIFFAFYGFYVVGFWDANVRVYTQWIFLLFYPFPIGIPLWLYITIFSLYSLFVGLGIATLIYVFYSKSTNEILCTICYWFCKLVRTVLFLPLLSVMFSPLLFKMFNGSETMIYFEGYTCLQFPFLLFLILGSVLGIGIIVVAVAECLFLLAKFYDIRILSSATDGRLNLIILGLNMFTLLNGLSVHYGFEGITIGISSVCFLCSIFVLFLILRFVFYFHFQFTYFVVLIISIDISTKFCCVFLSAIKSWYFMFSLLSLFPIILISWAILTTRYVMLIKFFKKKRIEKDFILCYYPIDIVIGIYAYSYYMQIKKNKKNIIIPSSTQTSVEFKMSRVIMQLLNNDNFEKSKELCVSLIPLIIDQDLPTAKIIINHTRTLISNGLVDTEFALNHYKNLLNTLQHSGDKNKKYLKLASRFNVITKKEDEIKRLFAYTFDILKSDEKISFSQFPQILTMLQESQDFCENNYQKLITHFPTANVYRKYARYLKQIEGNSSKAEMFLKEAKYLDKGDNRSETSLSDNTEIQRDSGQFEFVDSNSDLKNLEAKRIFLKNEREEKKKKKKKRKRKTKRHSASKLDLTKVEKIDDSKYEFRDDHDSFSKLDKETKRLVKDHGLPVNVSSSSVVDELEREKKIVKVCSENDVKNIVEKEKEKETQIVTQFTKVEIQVEEEKKELMEIQKSDEYRQEKVVYTKKDSIITASTSNLTIKNDYISHLRKKIYGTLSFSDILVRVFYYFVLFFSVGIVVFIIPMTFIAKTNYETSGKLLTTAVRLQQVITESAHFARKLQVSHYDESRTPIVYERNYTNFRRLTQGHCQKAKDRIQYMYDNLSEEKSEIFNDITVTLYEEVLELNENPLLHEYSMGNFTLLDATFSFAEKCLQVANVDEEVFYSTTFGSRLVDNHEFIFITLNEPAVYNGMGKMINQLEQKEAVTSQQYETIYICVLSSCSLIVIFGVITWLFFVFSQKQRFKGFLLIPKEQILNLFGKFKNAAEEKGSSTVDIVRFSMIQQFFIYIIIVFAIILGIMTFFTIFGIVTSREFITRNKQFINTLKFGNNVNRIHLWTVELLYRDDTLFYDEEIFDGLSTDVHNLQRIYNLLRNGDESEEVVGNDKGEAFKVYYNDQCDPDDYEYAAEKLGCYSVTYKVNMLVESAEHLLEEVGHLLEIQSNDTSIRGSEYYEHIIFLDNFSNDTIFDLGALTKDVYTLRGIVENSMIFYLQTVENLALLLVILFLPVFIVVFLIVLNSFPKRLSRNLQFVKKMMLLMDRRILSEKTIADYITGSKGFKFTFGKEKGNRIDCVANALEHSNYGVILFNNQCNIIRYNRTADELFNIRAVDATNVEILLSEESFEKLKKWMSRQTSLSRALNGELTAKYEDQEYTVLVDICRSEDLFIGIFENIESSKKKEMLREREQKGEKTIALLENILPREIVRADTFKLDQLLNNQICQITEHKKVTAYFCDICNFTGMALKMEAIDIINLLHSFFSKIDDLCDEFKLEKIKTIGDCYFAISGIPTYKPLHAKICMDFAIGVLKMIEEMNKDVTQDKKIYVRTGMSSGNLVAGIIGKRKWCYDTWGSVVNEAARMETHGFPGKIQVSRTTYESIFDKYEFMERIVQLQGIGLSVRAYVYTPSFINEEELICVQSMDKEKYRLLREHIKKKSEKANVKK